MRNKEGKEFAKGLEFIDLTGKSSNRSNNIINFEDRIKNNENVRNTENRRNNNLDVINSGKETRKERYKTPKGTAKNQKRKQNKNILKRVAVIAAAATLAVGGVSAYKASQKIDTVQERIEIGSEAQDMGISEESLQEYKELCHRVMSIDSLDETQRTKLAMDIYESSIDTTKEKLGNALNIENPENDIKLVSANSADEPAKVVVGDTKYVQADFFSKIFREGNTIDDKTAKYINEMGNLQTKIGSDEVSKKDMINSCITVMENENKFLAGNIKVNDKGNITIEFEKQNSKTTEKAENKQDNTNQIEDDAR